MNTEANPKQLEIEKVKEEIDDYLTTINVIYAFVGFVGRNYPEEVLAYSIGRKMNIVYEDGRISSERITPDLVIQVNESLGYVVEIKTRLPHNDNGQWDKAIKQLKKYDNDLLGWWTPDERINAACIAIMVGIERSVAFSGYIEAEEVEFSKPVSIIEFTRKIQVKEFYFIRKMWGIIEDSAFSKVLENGKSVSIEEIVGSNKRFYDAQPITEHTMVVLWQDIFTEMKSNVEFDEKLSVWPLEVEIEALTRELQRLFGSEGNVKRETAYPRNAWVREAMDQFVRLELASRGEDGNKYVVNFKRLRGDILGNFVKGRYIPKKKGKTYEQLGLFGESVQEESKDEFIDT